ncbi:MAG: AAA family ATPase [Gammaproteobacteria bacterium]
MTSFDQSLMLGIDEAGALLGRIGDNVQRVIRGQARAVRELLAAFAAGGHVLVEDLPGTGKTTLAKALARSLNVDFHRIQFTPDLLPADILGVSIFNQRDQSFEFHRGPVFTNVLLADEINRASPRTQSALLEAMGEEQVSLDSVRRPLEWPFFVIATQNPVESEGVYPLPEAQMDRFALRFALGYVSAADEVAILSDQTVGHPLDALTACASREEVTALRHVASSVRISSELKHYVVALVNATRYAPGVRVGASPRASLALMKCAQALALIDGQTFVTPELLRELAPAVLTHRVLMEPQAEYSGRTAAQVVEEALGEVPVPA